jgi:hypothetical protein
MINLMGMSWVAWVDDDVEVGGHHHRHQHEARNQVAMTFTMREQATYQPPVTASSVFEGS